MHTLKQIKCEWGRRDFWEYEKLLNPDFFTEERPHLKELAIDLQAFYEGRLLKENGEPYTKFMMNLPPRHGKSYTLTNYSTWVLGTNPETTLITICYNSILSGRFSKAVRNTIDHINLQLDKYSFAEVFPATKIKQGDASAQLWSIEGQHFTYLGSSFGGTITGIGAKIGLIDDPIKNKEDAYNDRVLEAHWDFYTDTYLSRLEEGALQVINMTRWSTQDLCGKLLDLEPEEWYVHKRAAYNEETGEMLCPSLFSNESYEDKKTKTSPLD